MEYYSLELDFGEEEELELPWLDEKYDDDWQNFVAENSGLSYPNIEYEGNEKIFSEYWDKQRKLIKELGCEVGIHCSSEYACIFVSLTNKTLTASRGYPEEVTKDFMEITEEDIEKLKRFCELLEMPWSEPKWHLASYWG